MKQGAKTPRNCLILGGGALGLLLHYNLTDALSQNGSPTRRVTHSRTTVPEPILFEQADEEALPLQVEYHTGSAQSCLKMIDPELVFICVPPESTEEVLHTWLAAMETWGQAETQVQIIFCNNGCLNPATLSRIQQAHPRFSFLRALFFVGAMRTVHADHTIIRWTGGKRVVWDWLRLPFEQRSSELPAFLSCTAALDGGQSTRIAPGKSTVASLGFTQWMRETNIFAAERCKFFTNFMLAAAVGPQLAKNKTLSERLEDSIVSHQAQQFAVLWEHHGVNAEQLKSTLLSTVADTGENINSLSYAAVQGKTGTMAWFIQSLEEDIRNSPRRTQLDSLVSFLRSVRKNWRME